MAFWVPCLVMAMVGAWLDFEERRLSAAADAAAAVAAAAAAAAGSRSFLELFAPFDRAYRATWIMPVPDCCVLRIAILCCWVNFSPSWVSWAMPLGGDVPIHGGRHGSIEF